MKHSDSMQHLAPAFAEICGALSNPVRNRTVTVRPKNKPSYEFTYATLDSILDLIRPICHANKCALTQVITKGDDGVRVLETVLLHESGEWMSSEVDLVLTADNPKAVGSILTYYRRYAICALFPIAGLEDDAASVAEGDGVQEGSSTKALMTGRELSEKHAAEFFERESLTIAVRDNNWDQWRGWMEALIKWAGAPPLLVQLWNDNDETLANVDASSFNRLKKLRNARFADWKMEVPAEWQDTPKQPELPVGDADGSKTND